MLRSVRSRVVALTIGVALVAVAVTAALVSRSVESSLQEVAEQSLETDTAIFQSLADWGAQHDSWSGVDDVVAELASLHDRRIALKDPSGRLIVDSDRLLGLSSGPLPRTPVAEVDPYAPVLTTNVFVAAVVPATADELALNTERLAGATECLDDAALGYDVSTDESGLGYLYPTDALTDPQWATFSSCADVLDLPSPEQLARTQLENRRIVDCMEAAGFAVTVVDDEYGGFVDPGFSDAANAAYSTCFETIDRAAMAPPVELFLGSGGTNGLSLRGFGVRRLVLIVTAVLAAAVGAAWVAGRLITRPLGRLADAARSLGAGQLDARVMSVGSGEVADVATAFNTMADTLSRNETSRRQMVSDIAHELRNPLVTINGTLEAIQDGVYEPTPEVIDSLAEEAEQLRRLVSDLQELAAADAGSLRLHEEPIDLSEVARNVVDSHRALAAASGVELSVIASPGAEVVGDPGRLRQVLTNLVSNALRYTPAGGSTTVAVRTAGDGVELTVSDTGSGIAPEHLASVFDRFWRADPARARNTGGSGLGLAITRELVAAHGGEIRVDSEVGQGTTFTVRLPAAVLSDPSTPA